MKKEGKVVLLVKTFSLSRQIACKRIKLLRCFTLIEIMLVVIIIGVLAAMVGPRLTGRTEQAKSVAAKADITSLSMVLDLYEMDNGEYPQSLDNLLAKPSSAPNWLGPYTKKKPGDPWGRDYVYQYPGTHSSNIYDLYSLGKDGKPGTADDVSINSE